MEYTNIAVNIQLTHWLSVVNRAITGHQIKSKSMKKTLIDVTHVHICISFYLKYQIISL